MPETAKRTARVPILGEDGRISDDYIPAAIGENVTKAESAATRAESAATRAESAKTDAEAAKTGAESFANNAVAQAQAAKESADGARGSASRAQQSATAAQQSATEAGERADSVLDHYVESATATTLDPGQPATAEVVDKVLNLGIPRGEKGDRGDTGTGVPEGGTPGQLLSKTDSGAAWVDPPSGNVLVGTATGYVAHAEDAYAAKPREVRVKGRTVKNLWPVINGTSNGVTVSTDKTGLITVSGTATADATITAEAAYAPSSAYVMASTYGSPSTWHIVNGETQVTSGVKLAAPSATCGVVVKSGTAVDASFRVMLVEGTEAPDCFTPPASITSVQTGNLVTAGKNLLARLGPSLPYTYAGITFSDNGDGGIRVSGTATSIAYYNFFTTSPAQALRITPGEYAASLVGGGGDLNLNVEYFNDEIGADRTSWLVTSKPGASSTGSVDRPVYLRPFLSVANGKTVDTAVYPQLELGSTATAYESPNVTTTPLPEVELRSLPDGTCDELVIGADGTATVERRTQLSGGEAMALPEPTTETLDAVSLPKLPAPTFNIYHDSQVPSDTSVEYERDVNIAYAELEAKIAALTVAQATS